jgi:hypothetical protein
MIEPIFIGMTCTENNFALPVVDTGGSFQNHCHGIRVEVSGRMFDKL